MNDRDALLHAIGEHPEEDTPRLMYADWLEENGEPERADFVRNQVELGRPGISAAEKHPFVRKNVHYLMNWERHWREQLPKIDGIEWGDFNRGLIEEVRAATETPVVRYATAIFAVPGIHILRLWRLTDGGLLAGVPELVHLRVFRVIYGAQANALRDLFASPHLAKLTAIDLHGSRANNVVVAELADGRFPDLADLRLSSNAIGDNGALALANSPHLTKLRHIDLYGNPINDRAARSALRKRFGTALQM
jgi:uncharacterized protein (TIGR02996 family)